MTSHSDLLEAQSFARDRLLGVLVAGAPRGDEGELPRSGRPLAAGVAVGLILVVVTVVVELLAA